MKTMSDRKKLRREYLRTKRKGYAAIVSRSVLLVLVLSSFFFGPVLLNLFGLLPVGRTRGAVIAGLIGFLLFGSAAVGVRLLGRINQQVSDLRNLPPVPPVTPNTLPADEILVRGSEEPPIAQREVLLRAAQQGQETPKEELLRVSQE